MFAFLTMMAVLTCDRPAVCIDEATDRGAGDSDAALADRVVGKLIRNHERLDAVSLVYMSIPRDVKGEPDGSYWRRSIALSSAGMFRSDNSHGHSQLSWQYDPDRKLLYLTPSNSVVLEHLNRAIVHVDFVGIV